MSGEIGKNGIDSNANNTRTIDTNNSDVNSAIIELKNTIDKIINIDENLKLNEGIIAQLNKSLAYITTQINKCSCSGVTNIQDNQLTEKNRLEEIIQGLKKEKIELKEKHDNLEQIANIDKLTSLFTRRIYDNDLTTSIQNLEAKGTSFTMAVLDIDKFKEINDTYGHYEGDRALQLLAKGLQLILSKDKLGKAYRYGGEEFVIISNISDIELKKHLDNFLEYFNNNLMKTEDKKTYRMTFSGGVKTFKEGENLEYKDYFEIPDTKLLKAKETGRNRVLISE